MPYTQLVTNIDVTYDQNAGKFADVSLTSVSSYTDILPYMSSALVDVNPQEAAGYFNWTGSANPAGFPDGELQLEGTAQVIAAPPEGLLMTLTITPIYGVDAFDTPFDITITAIVPVIANPYNSWGAVGTTIDSWSLTN